VWWCRFFQLAVFATMYVRDHARPEFHKALGMTATEYDRRVLRITSDICRQVFPVTLDVDNPAFQARLARMSQIATALREAKSRPGIGGRLRRLGLQAAAGGTFIRLLLQRGVHKALPDDVRLAPAW
jgi:magnesium-protoporphyrin IX monomethyl ester (oxidative) cyclase